MQPSAKINPNALCSCDSGKKYKQCCLILGLLAYERACNRGNQSAASAAPR